MPNAEMSLEEFGIHRERVIQNQESEATLRI